MSFFDNTPTNSNYNYSSGSNYINNNKYTNNTDNSDIAIEILLRIRPTLENIGGNSSSLYDGREYLFNNKSICVHLVEKSGAKQGDTLRISYNDTILNANTTHNFLTSPSPVNNQHAEKENSNSNNKYFTFDKIFPSDSTEESIFNVLSGSIRSVIHGTLIYISYIG